MKSEARGVAQAVASLACSIGFLFGRQWACGQGVGGRDGARLIVFGQMLAIVRRISLKVTTLALRLDLKDSSGLAQFVDAEILVAGKAVALEYVVLTFDMDE